MPYDPRNKVVLITGASSGIGRATAIQFHRAGSIIAAAARSHDKLTALAQELGNNRILPIPLDVTDPAARAAALQKIRDDLGPIDILINNAGWASFGTVQNIPQQNVDRMIALNFLAPIALTRAVLPDMIVRRSGQIINISSVVGYQPIPRMTVYSATKSALNGFTTGLRMELKGTGVDVLLVAPGSTATPFFDSADSVDAKATRVADSQYSPQRVARAILTSSRRRRKEAILTAEGKAICTIRRLSHKTADAIMHAVAKRGMPGK